MKKRIVFRILKIALIVLIIAAVIWGVLYYMYAQQLRAAATAVQTFRTAAASKGDIELSVSGTGSISPQDTTDIVIDWSGTVKEVNFEKGDLVNEGDIIAKVVNDTISSDIASAQSSLRQQEINLEKQKENLTSNVVAPEGGRVKMLKVEQGDNLSTITSAFGQACYISPDEKFTMTFTHTYTSEIKKDSLLQVRDSDGLFIKAVVTEAVDKKLTIDILDDIMLDEGEYVQVFRWEDKDTVIGEGYANIKNAIKVSGTGKVTQVLTMENEIVSRGQELFRLDTTDAELSFESQTISVSDAQRKIADLRKDVGKDDIPAPTSGVISSLSLTRHANAASGTTIATIMSVDKLETVVSIDELDIAKVALGQKAKITLDALEGRTFTGVVTDIAVMGTISNGFATFPVTVTIDDPGVIKIGMSCEVEIIVDDAAGALMLPVEVLSQDANGYYVNKIVTYEPGIHATEQSPLEAFLSGLFGGAAGGGNLQLVSSGAPQGMSGTMPQGGTPPTGAAQGETAQDEAPQGGTAPDGSAQGTSGDSSQRPQRSGGMPDLSGGDLSALARIGVVSATDIVTEVVRLEVGIVNENYAQILSGLTPSDVIVYANDASGSNMMQMMMMGGMGGGGTVVRQASPAGGPGGGQNQSRGG